MDPDRLKSLQIASEQKARPTRALWGIFLAVGAIVVGVAALAWPRARDSIRLGNKPAGATKTANGSTPSTNAAARPATPAPGRVEGSVLTVSGYIIPRERIELSPRFMGVVKWIGVKKGDRVTKGQVLVRLDDAEQRVRVAEAEARMKTADAAIVTAQVAVPDSEARLAQADARVASARAALSKAELDFERATKLFRDKVETKQLEDDTRLRLETARAAIREAEAALASAKLAPTEARARLDSARATLHEATTARSLAQLYLDWTVIRSPVDGVVLEKLVDPDELVVPQSFGGGRGPSTALVALADPSDLQVEIDLNESDLAKVFLRQKCRVTPEAYPDRGYDGFVAEIAPEASRQKGTLQIKVQVLRPDRFLTPELSAKVDFLGVPPADNPATNTTEKSAAPGQ
ncbi:MAG: HlyD family efflux transporter periplasmic adaptor subunit [Verrucomicrobia bacterium]|nr:HlyD family efflux transporter periplasmic adaptor subunit [Verrucomicrobiota bacterium]